MKASDVVEEARTRLVLQEYEILHTTPTDYPGNYHGYDDTWSLDKFKQKLKMKIIQLEGLEMEFDIIGVDPSIPNAFRRIMMSDIPTMAFDKVLIYNNTSIIQDEVLAHRLGLIPLKADPRLFEMRQDGDTDGTRKDTLKFELKLKCSWNPAKARDERSCHTNPSDMFRDYKVLSSHLKWICMDGQQHLTADSVGPVHNDILIAKLRPGHEVDIELHAMKGTGRDHAKFSPVATAFFRLLPEVQLLKKMEGEAAERLQQCFSPGVIELVDNDHGKKEAKVKNARYDLCSRNVFRHEDLKDATKLTRVRDHFIFHVESTGALQPDELFVESVKIMIQKCRTFLSELEEVEKCEANRQ